jgi:MSHA biogenesis protein MshJ
MVSEKFRKLNKRVGALSLRERGFVFAAAVLVVFSLVQTLAIDTGQLRKRNANDRLQAAQSALQQIEQQRQVLAGPAGRDPDQVARNTLAAQEARLAGLNAELETRGRSLIPPERMQQVLKDVVQGQGGIRIVAFKTLSPQPVSLPGAAEGAPPGFYRHGFEMTVSGRYTSLVAYLERLEALPWRLNWIEATLDAASRPELTLTLTVHTLSLEEAWLRV